MATNKSKPYIKARYFIKSSGSVCCIIVSGEKEYHTWMHANGTASCDCDGHAVYSKTCKHIKLVVASEKSRYTEKLEAFAARYQAFLKACEAADAISAQYAKPEPDAKIISIAERAPLYRQQNDWLSILPSRKEAI